MRRVARGLREDPRGGVLAVVKPKSLGSAFVVEGIRRSLQANAATTKWRVGHGGTLDRAADGVLVIGVNWGCAQLTGFLSGTDKEYKSVARLGEETPSGDADTPVSRTAPFDHVTADALQQAMQRLVGTTLMAPPAFSALKLGGQRMSDLARQGHAVAPPPRPTTIHSLTLTDFSKPPVFSFEMRCASGTYVRSVAQELARAVGSIAHCTTITRTRQGRFALADALPFERCTAEHLLPLLSLRPAAAAAAAAAASDPTTAQQK